MTNHSPATDPQDAPIPEDVLGKLQARGITTQDETELRHHLERHVSSYTLFRLTPAAARKWKARYRIMLAADYLDCQSVAEAYARAILAALASKESSSPPSPPSPSQATGA